MNVGPDDEREIEKRLTRKLLDVLIRAGLVFVLAVLCYQVFAPFASLMAWASILAGVPFPGVLAAIMLVLGIAQVPALLVTLPAIGYIRSSGDYATVSAVVYTVLLVIAGMLDKVLNAKEDMK